MTQNYTFLYRCNMKIEKEKKNQGVLISYQLLINPMDSMNTPLAMLGTFQSPCNNHK